MPSIRESLEEMGISVEQVLIEMAQESTGEAFNKTVPTPLTNYLDVGRVLVPSGAREEAKVSCLIFIFSGFASTDSVFWGNQHRLSSPDVQRGV